MFGLTPGASIPLNQGSKLPQVTGVWGRKPPAVVQSGRVAEPYNGGVGDQKLLENDALKCSTMR
jgi:hypothetical protein